MSHWAEVDSNNKVIRVTVGPNDGDEGYQWLIDNCGGTWIKTSYNGNIRGNFAGIGYSYLKQHDLFMPVQCHDEAILNVETAHWDCPNSDHDYKPLS